MKVTPTDIPDVLIIEPKVFRDDRGFFLESFNAKRYAEAGMNIRFIQDNHSGSHRGTLRGLHYQIQHAQGKLIRVVAGEIYDAAVDLRRQSSTFGLWAGDYLSAENNKQIWIPPGMAHGFYVLSEWAEIIYKTTDIYAPRWERTLLWNDPAIGINWPLIKGEKILLSEKDKNGTPFQQVDTFE